MMIAFYAAAAAQSAGNPFNTSIEMQATWYGPGYEGKRTASGERFDASAFTAAHASLPLGSWVRVHSRDGRSVTVRINDRSRAEILDLSPAAARALHLLGKGTDTVVVDMADDTAEAWVGAGAPRAELAWSDGTEE
jgi:rare lipoprotein A